MPNIIGGDSGVAVPPAISPAPGGSPFLSPMLPDRASAQVRSNGDFWVDTKPGEAIYTPWDKLILGTTQLPGIWKLDVRLGHSFDPTKWQLTFAPQPPTFKNMLTDKGYNPAVLRAIGQVFTLADWNTLAGPPTAGTSFNGGTPVAAGSGTGGLADLIPKPGTNTATFALDITHPVCKLLGIDSVLVTEVHIPPVEQQTLIIEFSMIQYFPRTQVFTRHGGGGGQLSAGASSTAAPPNPAGHV